MLTLCCRLLQGRLCHLCSRLATLEIASNAQPQGEAKAWYSSVSHLSAHCKPRGCYLFYPSTREFCKSHPNTSVEHRSDGRVEGRRHRAKRSGAVLQPVGARQIRNDLHFVILSPKNIYFSNGDADESEPRKTAEVNRDCVTGSQRGRALIIFRGPACELFAVFLPACTS